MSQRYGERTRILGASANAQVSRWLTRGGGAVGIRSIQFVTVTNGTPATITAVTLANCVLLHLGTRPPISYTPDQFCGRLALTSTTQLTLTVSAGTGTTVVQACVLEFQPGVIKSRQTGLVSLGAAAVTGTATITSVDLTRAVLFPVGYSVARTTVNNSDYWHATLTLTNATTVTATRTNAVDNLDYGYQVIEFN